MPPAISSAMRPTWGWCPPPPSKSWSAPPSKVRFGSACVARSTSSDTTRRAGSSWNGKARKARSPGARRPEQENLVSSMRGNPPGVAGSSRTSLGLAAGPILLMLGFPTASYGQHSAHQPSPNQQLPADPRRHSHESAGLGTVGAPAKGGNIDLTTYLTTWNFSNLPAGERDRFYRETPRPAGGLLREYRFYMVNKEIEIAPGVVFPAWTYNGQVPGPTIR